MQQLMKSHGIILMVVAAIIGIIVVVGIIKNRGKGLGWIILFIIACIMGYLYISSSVIKP